jgi:hypothetical protein
MFFLYVGKCQLVIIAPRSRRRCVSQLRRQHCERKDTFTYGWRSVMARGKVGRRWQRSAIVKNCLESRQCKVTRPVVRRLQEAAIHPLQIRMHLLGFRKISRTIVLICLPYCIRMLPLVNRCGLKDNFSKMYVQARCFVQCYKAHYVVNLLKPTCYVMHQQV